MLFLYCHGYCNLVKKFILGKYNKGLSFPDGLFHCSNVQDTPTAQIGDELT